MSVIATGAGPFLISSELEYEKTRGWESVDTWQGTETECRTLQTATVTAGSATRVALTCLENGVWQLRISYPYGTQGEADDPPTNIFELEVAASAKSVYQSPVLRTRFSDYNANTGLSAKCDTACMIVGDISRKYQSGLPVLNSTDGKYYYKTTGYDTREAAIDAEWTERMAGATISGNDLAIALYLYNNIVQRGVTSFLEYNAVFRRTVTAGSPKAVKASFTGANQIWTTDEVVQFEGIPNDGWFILPNAQWHKDCPRVLASFGRKTQLTYSYTQVRTASALFYTAYGSASLIY